MNFSRVPLKQREDLGLHYGHAPSLSVLLSLPARNDGHHISSCQPSHSKRRSFKLTNLWYPSIYMRVCVLIKIHIAFLNCVRPSFDWSDYAGKRKDRLTATAGPRHYDRT